MPSATVNITSVLPSGDIECRSRRFAQVLLNSSRKIKTQQLPSGSRQRGSDRSSTGTRVQTHTRALQVLFTVKKKFQSESTNGRVLSRREGTRVRWAESQKGPVGVGLWFHGWGGALTTERMQAPQGRDALIRKVRISDTEAASPSLYHICEKRPTRCGSEKALQ